MIMIHGTQQHNIIPSSWASHPKKSWVRRQRKSARGDYSELEHLFIVKY